MATQAYWSGKKQYWNPEGETIQDHPLEMMQNRSPQS
jgi:hypothetical protein